MSWSCWPRSWGRLTCSSLSSRPAPRSRCCQPSLERKRTAAAAAAVREKVASVLLSSQTKGFDKTENTKCSLFYHGLALQMVPVHCHSRLLFQCWGHRSTFLHSKEGEQWLYFRGLNGSVWGRTQSCVTVFVPAGAKLPFLYKQVKRVSFNKVVLFH